MRMKSSDKDFVHLANFHTCPLLIFSGYFEHARRRTSIWHKYQVQIWALVRRKKAADLSVFFLLRAVAAPVQSCSLPRRQHKNLAAVDSCQHELHFQPAQTRSAT